MRWLRNILQRRTGGRSMAALATGTKAPNFELKTLDGKPFSLNDKLGQGPVVLAFFKVSCPTCQYALPFLERLHKVRTQSGIGMYVISQDDAESTRDFDGEFG